MKHLILIAIAFVTLQTTAQDKKKHQREGRMEMMKDLTPEERATIKTKHMTLELDLSTSQQAQVKDLFLQEAKERQKKMEARQNKDKDEKSKPTKEEYVQKINENLDDKIEMKTKMKAILSPEQYEKWELAEKERRKNGKQKGKRKGRR